MHAVDVDTNMIIKLGKLYDIKYVRYEYMLYFNGVLKKVLKIPTHTVCRIFFFDLKGKF